jgi:MerR family copper efflux transcriptional regulator
MTPAKSARNAPTMNIGALADKSRIAPKTIRYYEDIGLTRKADRLPNGYRAYSSLDLRELSFIKRARELGFSVNEVRDLLDLWRDKKRASRAVKALAASHLKALDRKIAELQAVRRSLAHLVAHCHGDERPECPILEDLEHA